MCSFSSANCNLLLVSRRRAFSCDSSRTGALRLQYRYIHDENWRRISCDSFDTRSVLSEKKSFLLQHLSRFRYTIENIGDACVVPAFVSGRGKSFLVQRGSSQDSQFASCMIHFGHFRSSHERPTSAILSRKLSISLLQKMTREEVERGSLKHTRARSNGVTQLRQLTPHYAQAP